MVQGPQAGPKEQEKGAVIESLHATASGQGLQGSLEVDEGGGGRREEPHRRDSGKTA